MLGGSEWDGENYTKRSFTIYIPQMLTTVIKSGKMGLSAGHVECLDCLGNIITNNAKCTREITSRIVMAKGALGKEKDLLYRQIVLKCREVSTEIVHLECGLKFCWKV